MKNLTILIFSVLMLFFVFGCIKLNTYVYTNTDNDTQLSNPASEKCVKDGGRLETLQDADGGEYGVCKFTNGARCDEWAYFRGECTPEKPNYCAEDSDCACGTHIMTGECFVGSKEFVNVAVQCPDYCTGIAAIFETRCVTHQCKIVRKNETAVSEFCGWSTGGECGSDNDCVAGGCGGQVCQSKNEPAVVTTCEYRDCYEASKYGLSCRCVSNGCTWSKTS